MRFVDGFGACWKWFRDHLEVLGVGFVTALESYFYIDMGLEPLPNPFRTPSRPRNAVWDDLLLLLLMFVYVLGVRRGLQPHIDIYIYIYIVRIIKTSQNSQTKKVSELPVLVGNILVGQVRVVCH